MPLADADIMEALARIEHKVDIALTIALATANVAGLGVKDLPDVNSPEHICPICGISPTHQADIQKAVVTRKCGCGTKIIPIDINSLAPPTANTRRTSDVGHGQQEDRPDTGSPGRNTGTRGTPSR